jgi:hypothetical protein
MSLEKDFRNWWLKVNSRGELKAAKKPLGVRLDLERLESRFALTTVGNASFENGVSPWVATGVAGVIAQGDRTWGNPTPGAPDGSRYAVLWGGRDHRAGTLSQALILSPGTYTVSFQAAKGTWDSTQGQPLQVSVNGTMVGAAIAPTSRNWAEYRSATFTIGTAGTHTITFAATQTSVAAYSFVDQIRLNGVPVSGVGNASFENGVSPWVATGVAGVIAQGDRTWGNPTPGAPDGSRYAVLWGGRDHKAGTLSQALILSPGTYTVSFQAAKGTWDSTQGQPLQVSVNGTMVGAAIAPTSRNWAEYRSATFTIGTAGTHTITFAATQTSVAAYSFIDHVKVVADVSPVVMSIEHGIVASAPGKFYGWPANGSSATWSWNNGREILVGYWEGDHVEQPGHNYSTGIYRLSRSLDGGKSWTFEDPAIFKNPNLTPSASPGGFNFGSPDFAMRITQDVFHVSNDRGKTWQGPYLLGLNDPQLANATLTSRTNYLVTGPKSALLFLSAAPPNATDKAFVAETTDGGKTFRFVSWIVPLNDPFRAVMPVARRLNDGSIGVAIRRRDFAKDPPWIDYYVSKDGGRSWAFSSRVAETGTWNGNPPGQVVLPDGRIVCVYGNRATKQILARVSGDNGKTWGAAIVLRNDFRPDRFGDPDLGYPQVTVNHVGEVVATYYWATTARPHEHIAVSRFKP